MYNTAPDANGLFPNCVCCTDPERYDHTCDCCQHPLASPAEYAAMKAERDRYRKVVEHIGAFVGDEDCTAQLATMARIALSAGT